jgi:hypothetical protein
LGYISENSWKGKKPQRYETQWLSASAGTGELFLMEIVPWLPITENQKSSLWREML